MLSQKQKRILIVAQLVESGLLSTLTAGMQAKIAHDLANKIATALEEADPSNDPQQTI